MRITNTQGWHQFADADLGMHRRAASDLDGILSYLRRTDDAATGAWILDDGPSVPLHTRRALDARADKSSVALALLRQAELHDIEIHGKPLTSYTDTSAGEGLDEVVVAEHIVKKDLPR